MKTNYKKHLLEEHFTKGEGGGGGKVHFLSNA